MTLSSTTNSDPNHSDADSTHCDGLLFASSGERVSTMFMENCDLNMQNNINSSMSTSSSDHQQYTNQNAIHATARPEGSSSALGPPTVFSIQPTGSKQSTTSAPAKVPMPPRKRYAVPCQFPQVPFDHRRTANRIWNVKKKHRTEINADMWDGQNHYGKKTVEKLTEWNKNWCSFGTRARGIKRINRDAYTPEQFYEEFMVTKTPVIVTGCMDGWPAMENWTLEHLEKRFPHQQFKCGEDDAGRRLRIKFKYFADYCRKQRDDSPIYLFQSALQEETGSNTLLSDFTVPDIMPFDFFNLVGADKKPPYRWFCIGPKRSGTTVHKDPLGTSAWNAVVTGAKRWVLFEPQVDKKLVKSKELRLKHEDDEAIDYFLNILPRIKDQIVLENKDVRIYEEVQRRGEVIFVPQNWWHGVVNLEDSIAITQNFCGYAEFDEVWKVTRKQRHMLAQRWLSQLKKYRPECYDRAKYLDQKYPMESDDVPRAMMIPISISTVSRTPSASARHGCRHTTFRRTSRSCCSTQSSRAQKFRGGKPRN
ncbi:unnamed protein product [Amoebophrya sp. A120]|nr:unnamed protein product [Amoebophrya sp. A120]|eukprot:GSA120T00016202001.1